MAVVGKQTSGVWDTNSDGLYWRYGVNEGTAQITGSYKQLGPRHMVEVTIDLDSLPTVASGNQQIQSDTVTIPNGALIEEVELQVTEETAGTNANLDIGLVDQDRSTEIDFNGLIAAGDDINGGTDLGKIYRYVVGSTDAGALIGTKLTNTGLITANAETADFTAGVVKCRVYYIIPLASDLSA